MILLTRNCNILFSGVSLPVSGLFDWKCTKKCFFFFNPGIRAVLHWCYTDMENTLQPVHSLLLFMIRIKLIIASL